MLRKGAIVVSDPKEDHFLSPWCLGKKRNGRNHPAVNLKDVNNNIPYQHTKQELLFPSNKMLLPYFVISYSMESRKNLRFWWKDLLYNFCCLCFRIFSTLLVFTRLLKVPLSLSVGLCLSVCLSVCVCVCLSVCLSLSLIHSNSSSCSTPLLPSSSTLSDLEINQPLLFQVEIDILDGSQEKPVMVERKFNSV